MVFVGYSEKAFFIEESFVDCLDGIAVYGLFWQDEGIFIQYNFFVFDDEEADDTAHSDCEKGGRRLLVEDEGAVWISVFVGMFLYEFFVKISIIEEPCGTDEANDSNDFEIVFFVFTVWSYDRHFKVLSQACFEYLK